MSSKQKNHEITENLDEKFHEDLVTLVDKYEELDAEQIMTEMMIVAFGVMASSTSSLEEGCDEMHDILDELQESYDSEES